MAEENTQKSNQPQESSQDSQKVQEAMPSEASQIHVIPGMQINQPAANAGEESRTSYLAELDIIDQSKKLPDVKLELIDLLFRDFIVKKFHLAKGNEYAEMIDYFLQKNKLDLASFCHIMVEALYSGEKIDGQKIKILIQDLQTIILKEQSQASGKFPKKEKIKDLFLESFNLLKKKESSESKIRYLGKKTKHVIDDALHEDQDFQTPIEQVGKSNPLGSQLNSPLYKLNPALMPSYALNLENEPAEYKFIQSIDDLDRIKEKIRDRKRAIYSR